jgi:glycosyltransferase involved in cell wall biosynthesis
MRILVVSQYFWPEEFKINDLCLGLKERGHEVTVLTGLPNYPQGKLYEGYTLFNKTKEMWNGIPVHRSWLLTRGNNKGARLALNYLSFAILASIKALFLRGKFDAIFVWETSPVTVGIPAWFAKMKFKAPIFFWIQDLWPHSISAAGSVNNKTLLKLTDRLTRAIYSYCDRLLIQSEGFRSYLHHQEIPDYKIVYYPNFSETLYTKAPNGNMGPKHDLPKGFNVLFAGNIGVAQDFPTILKAAAIVEKTNPDINWVILGEGRAKADVEAQIRQMGLEKRVVLKGYFPPKDMPCFFKNAQVLLVTLKDEPIFSLTVPSKVQSYLASGKPIVGALNGEGARILEESGAGRAAPAEQPEALASIVLQMARQPKEELADMGALGKAYFLAHFERNKLIDRVEDIFAAYFGHSVTPTPVAPKLANANITA